VDFWLQHRYISLGVRLSLLPSLEHAFPPLPALLTNFSWRENRDPPCDIRSEVRRRENTSTVGSTQNKSIRKQKGPARDVTKGNVPFSFEEDDLLRQLKERDHLPWNRISAHFPGRTKGSLQVRYSTRLKDRISRPPATEPSGRADSTLDVGTSSPSNDGAQDSSGPPTQSPCGQRYGPPRSRRGVDRYSPA
jgi:hypothetical protein